jgi:hypothetical protein
MREALSFKLRWPLTVYQLAVTNLSLLHPTGNPIGAGLRTARLAVDLLSHG